MRSTRSLTQPNDSAQVTKKHSSSSGSADAADAVSGGGTSRGNAASVNTGADRSGGPHNIQEAASQIFCKPLRVIVSQNRRRYQQEGFDLDLTYITDRIIAMGYPADSSEMLYRNSMLETQKFLEHNHRDHYKVFNLRGLYVYDPSKFHHRVMAFEMTDHHPPRLELMAPFCREVHEYLEQDPRNVVAVHCKAGKGRTGVMICAYLVYINFYLSPRQNMDYYSIVRTKNNKGVTIPSQRRYVYYFSHLRNHGLNYMPLRLELVGVFFERPPNLSGALSKKCGFKLRVANGDVDVFLPENDVWIDDWTEEEEAWSGNVVSHGEDSLDIANPGEGKDVISRRAWGWRVPPNKRVFLEGDVRVDLYSRQKLLMYKREKEKLGHIWFNTMFSCDGFCGGTYRHGDEAHPYPDGATTIAERRAQPHRPKTGSASLPNSPPVADAASRNSEPHIDRNADERTSCGAARKLDKRAAAGKEKERAQSVWDDDMELMLPPGLNRHCPVESLPLIYGSEKQPPRVQIESMLREAHKNNLIEDVYNHRRLSVPQEGQPVQSAPEGRPSGSGPNLLRRAPDEHVQVFSVLEIDRACKNKNIDQGFKMIIVTRCVAADSPSDQKLAESFMRVTHQRQAVKDKRKHEKVSSRQRKLQAVGSGASLGESVDVSAAAVASSSSGGSADADPRRSDPFMSKFFHRQREDSLSIYPAQTYRCALAASPPSESTTTDGLSSSSPSANDDAAAGKRPRPTASFTSGEWALESPDREDLSELDMEVRSYHPDAGADQSGSSRSSSSSDGCIPPEASAAAPHEP